MPPAVGKPFTRSDVVEEDQGSIFSRIPMWAWIGVGLVVLYVVYVKVIAGGTSTSNPAVATVPDQSGASDLLNNLGNFLSQINSNPPTSTSSGSTSTTGSGGVPGSRGANQSPPPFNPTIGPIPIFPNGPANVTLGGNGSSLRVAAAPSASPIANSGQLLVNRGNTVGR